MEFAELIKVSRIDNVRVRRPGKSAMDMTVAVTGHHLILSNTETNQNIADREIWLLHRGLLSVNRESESARSGTLCLKYKDLRTFFLDIIGPDNVANLLSTLSSLSEVLEPSSAYPFFYNHGFKGLEDGWFLFRPEEEYAKILLKSENSWRVSRVNSEFTVCGSYGRLNIVPSLLPDTVVAAAAKHRIGGRFPVPVYIHCKDDKQIPLARGSYTVAGWRSVEDERLVAGIKGTNRKGFIICIQHDKNRSSVTGKLEYDSVYPQWKRVNLKLPSLGDIRDSMTSLTTACNDPGNEKWLSRLANSKWLSHVKEILNAACLAAQLIDKEEAPVLIIEPDSVNLSLALVSLTQMLLNPDTRTLHGFEALVERDWIQAGHPFWTRHSPPSVEKETGPVFLIFLDCVNQIYSQFPCSFEFTERILVLLADHSFASPFGTFLCNNEKERLQYSVREHSVSLWSYLNQVEILSAQLNSLYTPNPCVLWPSVAPMSLSLWSAYFLRWVQDQKHQAYERKKITEIIERNKNAKIEAQRLRRELEALKEEAAALGLIPPGGEAEEEKQEGAGEGSEAGGVELVKAPIEVAGKRGQN